MFALDSVVTADVILDDAHARKGHAIIEVVETADTDALIAAVKTATSGGRYDATLRSDETIAK